MKNETETSRFAGIAANVGIAVLCLTLSAAVAKRVFWTEQSQAPPGQVKVGDRVALPNVKLGPGETVVLALREGCHFCEASAPLYKQLVEAAQSDKGKRVVACCQRPPIRERATYTPLAWMLATSTTCPLASFRYGVRRRYWFWVRRAL